jgi:hypothetical protein
MKPQPMDTIQAINRSLRCFVFGLLAFIPALGLVMAVIALKHGRAVRRGRGHEWNPARRYLQWGRALAVVGAFSSSLFGLLLVAIANSDFSSGGCYGGG